MKNTWLVATTLMVISAPAAARDNSAYFGIEAGGTWISDSHVNRNSADFLDINHKTGVDGDLILGYDFGLFRAEIEGAYKWAKHDTYHLASGTSVGADGHSRAYSLMGNAMIDLGDNERVNFYAGGGAGLAMVRQTFANPASGDDLRDSNFAWQGIAGIRAPVFRYFDVGLKYRYFDGGRIKDTIGVNNYTSRYRSHSVLASLIYNFADLTPPPPPLPLPPPPAPAPLPPASQTCADGSVILATDACPAPPPPPPPPAPTPERGD